jgi:hypothetical protein
LLLVLALPSVARAGWEASVGASWSETTYTDPSYTGYSWTRHWSAGFGYRFSDLSEIEVSYQDSFDRINIANVEDTSLHDVTYGVNWVQNLLGRGFAVQPYVKAGLGELNRDLSSVVQQQIGPPQATVLSEDQVTCILGVGLRLYLTRTLAIRGEATTFVTSDPSGQNGGILYFPTWKDNISATVGISYMF